MPKNILTRGYRRSLDRAQQLNRAQKVAFAGVGTLGVTAVALAAFPAGAQTTTTSEAAPAAKVAYSSQQQIKDVHAGVADQLAGASQKVAAIEAQKEAAAKQAAAQKKAAAEKAAAAKKAAAKREAKETASRSAKRAEVKKASVKSYPNNLDGWIREARAILAKHDIPGTYSGIHRNIIRESSGNPKAINDWDINAINGIPSKGLLQVIPPTFKAYHVAGTSWDIYDPVANIAAACNYAADKYGSMDNVNSAY
ncbi:transglycosylase SLT domain-containing protein [Streptomyces sp. SID5910]|uniref:transglycosylase SLT domain-containing protein n=1 Tax=Streptomyces sp. SID5910 TaxID=2690312 RepID=UPI00136DD563|nr:transglycosylase SLT domain-containing protein [Streptomyces sp. SID5910]MYR41821.1 transglycosylase SLT domain-containing protein [Streptomyces sp. SID5910]